MGVDRPGAEEFAELAQRMHDEPTVEETVEVVLDYAVKAVGGDGAGVIFVHDRKKAEIVAATDEIVAELTKAELKAGSGPNLAVLDEGDEVRSIIVSDTEHDARWPRWSRAASAAGVGSFLNVRLNTRQRTIGALVLYSRAGKAFDRDDQAVAHILARHAAVAIGTTDKQLNLLQAVDSRKRIGQAQGILMERYDLDEARAFSVLIRCSQDNNIKLRDVAQHLVDTGELPG